MHTERQALESPLRGLAYCRGRLGLTCDCMSDTVAPGAHDGLQGRAGVVYHTVVVPCRLGTMVMTRFEAHDDMLNDGRVGWRAGRCITWRYSNPDDLCVLVASLHVRADRRGEGIAGVLLDMAVAHYEGLDMRLMAVPYAPWSDRLWLKRDELEAFYNRRGFFHEPSTDTGIMSRMMYRRS